MDERLAAAETALKAGNGAEVVSLLMAAIDDDANQPSGAYRVVLNQLFVQGRNADGAAWAERGVKQHPRDPDLYNFLGVFYRRLARYPDALTALDQAAKLAPNNLSIHSNRGNVLLDLDDGVRAEALFTRLVRAHPRNADFVRQLGRALHKQGKTAAAFSRARQAVALQKTTTDAWLDMVSWLNDEGKQPEAEAIMEKALEANPDHPKILEAMGIVMRRGQQIRRTDAFLVGLLPRFPDAPWLHYQIGVTVADIDRERANIHLRRAVELEPDNLERLLALIESLERTRTGDEGTSRSPTSSANARWPCSRPILRT